MRHAARTHIGLIRDTNQDTHACAPDRGFFVIADGMGGLSDGEVASRMAADLMLAGLTAGCDPVFGPVTSSYEDVLTQTIRMAQEHVAAENDVRQEVRSMGTTLIGAIFSDTHIHYAHSGDSRIYIQPASAPIIQLTKDQTVARKMIDRGEDAARATALHGHILTNFIGVAGAFEPQIAERRVSLGDTVLMCTDGLSDMIVDAEIGDIVADGGHDVETIADNLIACALDNGGRDNITVIVIQPDG